MGEFQEILHDRRRIGTGAVHLVEDRERFGDMALHQHVEQIVKPGAVGKPQHVAQLVLADLAIAGPMMGDRLIQQRKPVAHRSIRGARDQIQRAGGEPDALAPGYVGQVCDQGLRIETAQIEPLAPRDHGDRDLAHLGGGEDELDAFRRLLQRLQQCVEGARRQHVDFVDDVDLVTGGGWQIAHAVDQLANVRHPGTARGVHLENVDVAVLADGDAVLAHTARFTGRPAGAVGADAVQRAGDDARRAGLADAAHAGEDERMGQTIGGDRVGQGADHRILTDQFGEGLWPVLAGEDEVGRVRLLVGHLSPSTHPRDVAGWEAGQATREKPVTAASFRT